MNYQQLEYDLTSEVKLWQAKRVWDSPEGSKASRERFLQWLQDSAISLTFAPPINDRHPTHIRLATDTNRHVIDHHTLSYLLPMDWDVIKLQRPTTHEEFLEWTRQLDEAFLERLAENDREWERTKHCLPCPYKR